MFKARDIWVSPYIGSQVGGCALNAKELMIFVKEYLKVHNHDADIPKESYVMDFGDFAVQYDYTLN
jgi:hypothetical protein